MTSPDGFVPGSANTGWGDLSDMAEAFANEGLLGLLLGGFGNVLQAIFNTVDNGYVAQLPIITDHSQSITEIRAELEAATIFGNARVFTSNHIYYATPGTIEAFVIMIGAGGGGASGRWDLVATPGRVAGAGGGGGGETHFAIPGNLLFDTNGDPKPIPILVGVGGNRGSDTNSPGSGGGHSSIAGVIAGGGNGGATGSGGGATTLGGLGGVGVIPGGKGGDAYVSGSAVTNPGESSISVFGELYGGGGGGGSGGSESHGSKPWGSGGPGGVSPGGALSGEAGSEPAEIIATGGGGGAGRAANSPGKAGDGAYPGGGGGGGGSGAGSGNWSQGGDGADGIAYVIERAA